MDSSATELRCRSVSSSGAVFASRCVLPAGTELMIISTSETISMCGDGAKSTNVLPYC